MASKERRQRHRSRVRQVILVAARELFVADGGRNVSLRQIADRIEYSLTSQVGGDCTVTMISRQKVQYNEDRHKARERTSQVRQCGRLLLVLCGAANELAESSLCTLELASPRRIIAKTK